MEKEEYVAPKITVIEVQMEQGIAAGSAQVNPGEGDTNIGHEWDDTPEVGKEFEW